MPLTRDAVDRNLWFAKDQGALNHWRTRHRVHLVNAWSMAGIATFMICDLVSVAVPGWVRFVVLMGLPMAIVLLVKDCRAGIEARDRRRHLESEIAYWNDWPTIAVRPVGIDCDPRDHGLGCLL